MELYGPLCLPKINGFPLGKTPPYEPSITWVSIRYIIYHRFSWLHGVSPWYPMFFQEFLWATEQGNSLDALVMMNDALGVKRVVKTSGVSNSFKKKHETNDGFSL